MIKNVKYFVVENVVKRIIVYILMCLFNWKFCWYILYVIKIFKIIVYVFGFYIKLLFLKFLLFIYVKKKV